MSISVLVADCVLLNLSNKKNIYKKLVELDSKAHFQRKTFILRNTRENNESFIENISTNV